jgi:2-dehydropantoate 2-reductase
MAAPLRIGIVGAGSIGCFVGGRLLAADAADVLFVGRPRLRDELAAHGLTLKEMDGPARAIPASRIRFETELAPLADCDAVLCCVKSAQTDEVAAQLAPILRPDTAVVSLQNGVRNPDRLRAALAPRPIVPGIVSFNVVSRGNGLFHRATSGPLMLGEQPAARARAVIAALAAALEVETRADLGPDQWTKLLVNLNNAVSALSGAPTRSILLSPGYRRVLAAIVEEAVRVARAAHVPTARLRGVPVGLMPRILRLPTPLVRLVVGAQIKVDPEARSSMWEDLTRGRPTEVDYLNGEIVDLARRAGVEAPLNRRVVELVHAAEQRGPGSPGLDAETLWARLSA